MVETSNSAKESFLWAQPGTACWVETSTEEKFYKAHIISRNDQTQIITVNYEINNPVGLPNEIPFSQIMRFNEQISFGVDPEQGFEDMVNMDVLNEAELLHNLRKRYNKDMIFTYIGPTLLVINPYKPINSDFSPEKFVIYSKQANSKIFVLKDEPAHVFAIGAKAFHQLINSQKNQAIVISGESGAGKTENTKFAMRFITSLSSEQNEEEKNQDTSIEEKILGCNPILEAFGNAKTVRNDNSSRFGKYVKIQIHRHTRKIKGAEITNYLLEKSRVTKQAKDERNYHIFYHLLGSQDYEFLKAFHLIKNEDNTPYSPEDFAYLNQSECYTVESLPDVQQYKEVISSFEKLKFKEEEKYAVWAILAAILLIGNLQFDDRDFKKTNEKEPIQIYNLDIYQRILVLLGVDEESLTKSLVYKSRQIGKDLIHSPLKLAQCIELKDALSKGLYEKLFNWLVKRMNMANEDRNLLTVGLLDIFGFENFKENSLEQLCINFTNEKLHQLYIEYVFISEKEELTQQGLKSQANSLILPQDNKKLIELFEGPNPLCIFITMKDSTIQHTTDDVLYKNIMKLKDTNPHMLLPKSKFDKKFVITHTADNVEYNIIGFKIKNNDSFPEELEKVIIGSSIDEIKFIYKGFIDIPIQKQLSMANKRDHCVSNLDLHSPKKSIAIKGIETLLQKFDLQMKSLMSELKQCDANFIRCIKPNELKVKEYFRSDYVLKQIKYLGVLESVKIRKDSFPFRKDFMNFWNHYKVLGKNDKKFMISEQSLNYLRGLCDWDLLRNLIIDDNDLRRKILFGSSKIYMKQELSNFIDKMQLNPEPKAIKSRLLVKQFRIWKRKDIIRNPTENLLKVCRLLRVFWNRLRCFVIRLKFLRKKQAVAILIKLLKKKLVKRICRVILFRKWKKASEIFSANENRYFSRKFLHKYSHCIQLKIIFLKNQRKIELMKQINSQYQKRLMEIKAKAILQYNENYKKRQEIYLTIKKTIPLLWKLVIYENFVLFHKKINEKIQRIKDEELRMQKEKEAEKLQKSTKIQTVRSVGFYFRKTVLMKKYINKLLATNTRCLKLKAWRKYCEFVKEKRGIEENTEKSMELFKIIPKEIKLPSVVHSKFLGKLELKKVFSTITIGTRAVYLKNIEPLQKKPEEIGLLSVLNKIEEISKENIRSEDIKYHPKLIDTTSHSFIPINNNAVLWKNIASQWVNKRHSVNLISIPLETPKDEKTSKEIHKLFKSYLAEKNKEKLILLSKEIITQAFNTKSTSLMDEVYYNAFIYIEKSPESFMRLLAMVSCTFPSQKYKGPIMSFLNALLSGTYSLNSSEDEKMKDLTRYTFKRFEKVHELTLRKTVPNEEELGFIYEMNKIPIRIFLFNDKPIWILIESYHTVKDVVKMVLNHANLDENLERFLGLFVRFPREGFIDESFWVMDYAFTRRIYLKMRWFAPLKEITGLQALDFLYIQAFEDYMKGDFHCPFEEIIDLGALAFYNEKGNDLEEEEFIIVNKYIPINFNMEEVDFKEIGKKISSKYSVLIHHIDHNSAKIEFLKILNKYEDFLAQCFYGDYIRITVLEEAKSFEEYSKPQVKMLVKPFEISFLWEKKGKKIKYNFNFNDICEFGYLSTQKAVFFRVFKQDFEEIHMLEHRDYEEIYCLIKGYADMLGKKENKNILFFKNI